MPKWIFQKISGDQQGERVQTNLSFWTRLALPPGSPLSLVKQLYNATGKKHDQQQMLIGQAHPQGTHQDLNFSWPL